MHGSKLYYNSSFVQRIYVVTTYYYDFSKHITNTHLVSENKKHFISAINGPFLYYVCIFIYFYLHNTIRVRSQYISSGTYSVPAHTRCNRSFTYTVIQFKEEVNSQSVFDSFTPSAGEIDTFSAYFVCLLRWFCLHTYASTSL